MQKIRSIQPKKLKNMKNKSIEEIGTGNINIFESHEHKLLIKVFNKAIVSIAPRNYINGANDINNSSILDKTYKSGRSSVAQKAAD